MSKKIIDLVREAQPNYGEDIILIKVDGKLHEVSDREISEDSQYDFVLANSDEGNDTYRRSVTMLMLYAFDKVLGSDGKNKVSVEFSLSKGLFCKVRGLDIISDELLSQVKGIMLDAVEKNLLIEKKTLKTATASKFFEERGMSDKAALFKYRISSYVNIYSIDGYNDYFYGYMAYSTGILKYFELYSYENGFVLQMPTKKEPRLTPEFKPQNKIFKVMNDTTDWADMLNLHTVAQLNKHITDGDFGNMILVQEALQEQKIHDIVNQIKAREGVKFVMIAGPSSSGKTTFSQRLSIQLMAQGLNPHPICVDDYFVERDETPKDENGDFDFECLEAIDVELFNKQMNALLAGERVELPIFNFKLGKKEFNGNFLQMGEDDILVIEGIHCLNDKLSSSLPIDSKFKIYISALTQLNIDEHNRVSTTDGRLIRRMVRDYQHRGASAARTLSMWASVRKGEEKNIFPYQEQADAIFNSSLPYEISALKNYVVPLLYSVDEDAPEYQEAKRLLKFVEYFIPCNTQSIPINSIIREFVGGGCFRT